MLSTLLVCLKVCRLVRLTGRRVCAALALGLVLLSDNSQVFYMQGATLEEQFNSVLFMSSRV